MADWFMDLFTLEHLGYFVLGVVASCAYHIVKAKIQRRIVVIKWQYITIPIVVALALYMAVENQQNANCTREFNQAIRDSREISRLYDNLSIEHRGLLSQKGRAETYMWVHILRPDDPAIAALPLSDPRRQAYGQNLVDTYAEVATTADANIVTIEDRQKKLIDSRPPLPDPTCGQ